MAPAHDDPRFLVEPRPEPAPRRRLLPWTTWLLALLAATLPVLWHRQYASGEAIVYSGDAAQLQFPRYVTLCEALQRGDFPQWQTLVYSGSPFHANPENPTLYPPTLLLAAFTGPGWTINGTVLLHLALCGLGMFVLVRRLALRAGLDEGPSAAGALLGATFFAFSLFTRRDHLNLVAYGAAHALIPWMLLAADGLLHGRRPRRSAGLLALAVAAIFTTGGLYVIPYAYLALGLWMVGLGLLGGREARRRTLHLGGWVALVALLLISAKLIPYREWLPTTNRAGTLTLEEALGTTLGGSPGEFSWHEVWVRTSRFLGGVWVLLPGLFALALLRHAFVRVALGLSLLGFAIGLGGTVWRFFYDLVPPFDQIRSAVRAWTLVNAFFPILAGLGTAWLLQRVPPLRRSGLATLVCGAALAGVYIPLLMGTDTGPRRRMLREPEQLSELAQRYPRWSEAAQLAGERWRVGSLDRTQPEGRNEQFATSLLGAETLSGYQGHVWPTRLASHLYGEEGERPLSREVRMRRMGVLSARWLVETDPQVEPTRDPRETDPPGIEGTTLTANPHARARLFLPSAVVGVVGDAGARLTRALLDHPRFPLQDATLLELPARGVSAEELAALDALVVVAPAALGEDVVERFRAGLAAQVPVLELPPPLEGQAFPQGVIEGLAGTVAQLAAGGRTVDLGFERDGVDRALLHVLTTGDTHGRFAVAAEGWSWYPGWRVEGLAAEPPLRVADGVATAFLLPVGAVPSPLVARYAPDSTRKGLAFGAVGLVLALGLLVSRSGRV
jgi:hypothetical protein